MRAICLVKHLEFDFSTREGMVRNALVIGDVDNDGSNELVAGNTSGDLCIFKNTEQWQKISHLGMITCVAVGDILNCGKNALVVISGDGWCHIFYSIESGNENNSGFESSDTQNINNSKSVKLECVHKQRIPANSKVVLLGDIDGDGNIEMVLGLTDRVVRSYRWCSGMDESRTTICDIKFDSNFASISGKLVGLNKWESGHQIGAVTLHHTTEGNPTLLVAQPGGTFMRIRCQLDDNTLASNDSNSIRSGSLAASCVDYQFLGLSRMRNQNISTEIIGDLKQKQDNLKSETMENMPYSLATLDGTIMLVRDEVILWSIQVDHQIFALEKLDITGDGAEEIIACSWDGQTYLLDQNKNSVRFQLGEPVQGFCCGYYNVTQNGQSFPSLVYVTFKNKIYLYYDFHLSTMVVKKLSIDLPIFDHLEDNTGLTGGKRKKQLIEWLLYGSHQTLQHSEET